MAYLIYNMRLSREVAKALLIDSAAGWNRKDDMSHSIGYGIVPKRIEEIIQSPNDEIRFIMTGSSESYETYIYNIPVPTSLDKHPFFARATLCYFPNCSRNQGVDYTNTEMDIHFDVLRKTSPVQRRLSLSITTGKVMTDLICYVKLQHASFIENGII